MMKLSELIIALEEIKYQLAIGIDPKVVVKCQVPNVEGWLDKENIKVENAEVNPDIAIRIVIEGGFGA